ncbi:MAG: hypothetical protein DRP94_03755 [Candidatus Latescibacterota bacterium]|nr:MAG: hypothetical protein DRP94_03755 [Candidatus Latescibacterota bacterium]HDH99800.1 hypothetical protein [Bacillota bacterium]
MALALFSLSHVCYALSRTPDLGFDSTPGHGRRGLRDMFTLGYLLAFGSLTQWVDMRLAFGFVAFVLLGLST